MVVEKWSNNGFGRLWKLFLFHWKHHINQSGAVSFLLLKSSQHGLNTLKLLGRKVAGLSFSTHKHNSSLKRKSVRQVPFRVNPGAKHRKRYSKRILAINSHNLLWLIIPINKDHEQLLRGKSPFVNNKCQNLLRFALLIFRVTTANIPLIHFHRLIKTTKVVEEINKKCNLQTVF